MAPRYIIHIGPLKTASTYIQECLTAARPDLEAKGICYPAELLDEHARFMHMPVYRALVRNQAETLRPVFQRLNAAGHDTILISCEHLIFVKPEGFVALREATGASDFKVVYTCRRWSDRLSSIWNQTLFMGATHSLPEFYLAILAGEAPNYYPKWMKEVDPGSDLDYSISWRAVEAVFGRDALEIFPYSAINGSRRRCLCPVLQGCARPGGGAADKTHRHQTLGIAVDAGSGNPAYAETSYISTPTAARATRCAPPSCAGRKNYDTAAIAAAIEPYVAKLTIDDANVQFNKAFNNMKAYTDRVVGNDVLFERKHKQARYVQPGYLLQPGIGPEIHGLYDQITRDLAASKAAG